MPVAMQSSAVPAPATRRAGRSGRCLGKRCLGAPCLGAPCLGKRCRAAAWAVVSVLAGYLVAPTPAAAAGVDVRRELECLALTIYFEARGEPDEGKIAVGHVVMNRASHPLFPHKVCEVVQQGGEKLRFRCQFTWWCDGRSDQPADWRAWEKSKALARRIFWDYSRDPTAGALWYHADYARPRWRGDLSRGPKIGRHVFYGLAKKWDASDLPDWIPAGYNPDQ